ncbi:MAG: hypothetical protein DMF68_10765 [Acidobacteria bacterium]|nr:MAG: hypothetical protein DMF68_10765 [Acidobacteriota bacterium]
MNKQTSHCASYFSMMGVYVTLLILAVTQVALAQQSKPTDNTNVTSAADPARTNTLQNAAEDQYRIGPGDVVEIRFFNRPQLSGSVRVSMSGKIQMPLIEGEIQAACKTEGELAKDIATLYLKYQRNPYVDVFVREYASTPVAVVGAVDKPGRFQLTRRIRLLELLAYAGGPTDKAGGQIVVAHTGNLSICEAPEGQNSNATTSSEGFITYSLKETLRGEAQANPWVDPGDMVSITEADQAYVVGNVFKPQPIPLKEQVTVSQAIAMAGGVLPSTKSSEIRVFRKMSGTTEQKLILVNLGAVKQRKAEDIALQANDIVEVPTSTRMKILESIRNAITPAASNLPYIILH